MADYPRLWHFTCDHGHRGIGTRGMLKPHLHTLMPQLGPVVWLIADGAPDRDDVGLTSVRLSCDRMVFRYRVVGIPRIGHDVGAVVPWAAVRDRIDLVTLADLERYAEPSTWWLATVPVEAVLA